ncbi:unnamed protein product, partial [marine sediment metagenome]
SKSTPSGGADTSGAGGADTRTSGSESGTPVPVIASIDTHAVTNVGDENKSGLLIYAHQGAQVPQQTHTHQVTILNHYHSVPAHTHPAHDHTVEISDHTHDLVFGIYEEAQSPTINVWIADDGENYGDSIGEYSEEELDIDITEYISGTGFKKIKFTTNLRTRISAWVLCKIDLSA